MKRMKGFTLIELLIVIVVIGILLTVAVPSFRNMIYNMKMVATSNDVIGAINQARAEAVRAGRSVRIDALTVVAGNEWGSGLRVWVDRDGNGVATDDEIFRETSPVSDMTISTASGASSVVFYSYGGADATQTITVCDSRTGETGRQILLLVGGSVITTQIACA